MSGKNKTRLERLENRARPKDEISIEVYLEGEDGLLYRRDASGEVIEVLTREELEALPGEHIHVRPPGEEREE